MFSITAFVTGNAGKLREVRQILGAANIEVDSQELDSKCLLCHFSQEFCLQLSVPEVQGTTQEVAIAKCRRAAELLGGPCITEDTALCFEALNGLPGPYIKYFLKELGHDGSASNRVADKMDAEIFIDRLEQTSCGVPNHRGLGFVHFRIQRRSW